MAQSPASLEYCFKSKATLEDKGDDEVTSYFCKDCSTLLRIADEIVRHQAASKHCEFWVSTNNKHNLYCFSCGETFISRTEADQHMSEYNEEHKLFFRKGEPPRPMKEHQTPSHHQKGMGKTPSPSGPRKKPREKKMNPEPVAYQFDDDIYESESEIEESSEEEDCDDPNDEDYYPDIFGLSDEDLSTVDAAYINLNYSDDSAYEDDDSMVPALVQLRTLKNLKLNADLRRVMRSEFVLAEGRENEVALRRVKNERRNFEVSGAFSMRGRGSKDKRAFVVVPELGQLCLKKLKLYQCTQQKGKRIYAVLGMIQDLLEDEKISGMRENILHYMYPDELSEPNLKEQELKNRVSKAVSDISAKTLVSRESFKLRASPKGLIAGAVKLYDSNGLLVDCNLGGESGVLIPSQSDLITRIEATNDSVSVVVVEKDTVFHFLVGQQIHKTHSCILVTGKGQPDVATRILLRKLKDSLPKARFFGLVDCNPSGIQIMATYSFGSEERAHDNLFLTVSDIEYIGLHIDHVADEDWKPLTSDDLTLLNNLLDKSYFLVTNTGKALRESLMRMKQKESKADIDVLVKKKRLVEYIGERIASLTSHSRRKQSEG